MKSDPMAKKSSLIKFSVIFYLLLLIVEFFSMAINVFVNFTGHKVTSSLGNKIGEGVRLLAPSILLYILTLLIIYVIFGVLNGHYANMLSSWLENRSRRRSGEIKALLFLLVNGTFLLGLYVLNATLYPASNQAFIFRGLTGPVRNPGVIIIAALALLAFYLGGFVILSFRFSRKPILIASLAFWLVLIISPLDPAYLVQRVFSGGAGSINSGPNVVFIGIDSMNPLHTSYFGYPLPLTPYLDEFLNETVVFHDAYTPIARTFPSWYSILTGQYPVTNGVRLNLMKRKYIKSADRCLGHVLRSLDYATCFITDEVRFSNITAEDGFDALRHPPIGIKDFFFGSVHDFSLTNVFFNNPLGYRIFPFLDINRAVAHLYNGRYFINDVVTTIDRLKKKEKFFLTAHLCMAHWPYTHAMPRNFDYAPGGDPLMALYDSAVFKADEQFGRIIAALKERGLYDRSIIVVLSDHGESAEGHGSDLRDPAQNRTLLAIKPAGPTRHINVPRMVRTIDIAPTVLDLLGQHFDSRSFDGLSLKPLMIGVPGTDLPDTQSIFMETEFSLDTPGGIGIALQSMIEQGAKFYEFDRAGRITVRDDYQDILVRRRNRAILTPDWKLVHDVIVRGETENTGTKLYNVRSDPLNSRDVSSDQPAVFLELWNQLCRYYGSELKQR